MKRTVGWGWIAAFAAIAAVGFGFSGRTVPAPSCHDTAERVRALEQLAAGTVRPPGSVLAAHPYGRSQLSPIVSDSGCTGEDSVVPWLYASRVYTRPGTRADLLDFYRTAAVADGWQFGADRSDHWDGRGGLCFVRTVDGRPVLLFVDFRFDSAFDAGPGVYRLEVAHRIDDSSTGC